jgi:phosphopantetheinyl transferase
MGRATIWIFADGASRTDDFGRARAPSGRQALRRASSLTECSPSGRPCSITRGPRGNSWCARCADTWSVSHSGCAVLVARAPSRVGVDAEAPRSRPAAFRYLTRVTGASIVSIEQWTQAEALWKAAGNAHRRPLEGELVMPESYTSGWNTTTDSRWSVFTRREPALVWSCALPNDGDRELDVRDLRPNRR